MKQWKWGREAPESEDKGWLRISLSHYWIFSQDLQSQIADVPKVSGNTNCEYRLEAREWQQPGFIFYLEKKNDPWQMNSQFQICPLPPEK